MHYEVLNWIHTWAPTFLLVYFYKCLGLMAEPQPKTGQSLAAGVNTMPPGESATHPVASLLQRLDFLRLESAHAHTLNPMAKLAAAAPPIYIGQPLNSLAGGHATKQGKDGHDRAETYRTPLHTVQTKLLN